MFFVQSSLSRQFATLMLVISSSSTGHFAYGNDVNAKPGTCASLLKSIKNYDANDFYDFIGANVTLEQLAVKEYGAASSEIISKLSQLGPQFTVLAADLRITNHLSQFVDFVKSQGLFTEDPSIVREKFREHSRKRTVYRGISLTDRELELIKKNGMLSNFLGNHYSSTETRFKDALLKALNNINDHREKGMLEILRRRIDYRYWFSREVDMFLSVTNYADLAGGFAAVYAARFGRGKKSYIFELEVPEVDLISLRVDSENGLFEHPESTSRRGQLTTVSHERRGSPDKAEKTINVYDYFDPDRELILTFKVEPGEIKAIHYVNANLGWSLGWSSEYQNILRTESVTDERLTPQIQLSNESFLQKYTSKL